MSTLSNLAQAIEDPFRTGQHFSVTKIIRSSDATDRVDLPEGLSSSTQHVVAITVDTTNAALTVDSISQQAHPGGAQVTVSGGTAGAEYFVVALHNGNAAGL
jgi:hypothetical protein